MTRFPDSRRSALIALCVFAVAIGSLELFRYLPPPLATPAWKVSWLFLCFVGLRWAHGLGVRGAIAELGLRASPVRGVVFGFLASIPLLVVFALTLGPSPHFAAPAALQTAVLTPVTEEVLFRGYVFLQLYRRAGWSFPLAVIATAVMFGLAHLGALAGKASALQVLGEVGMLAAGGAFFAWLLVRWHDNLWVPIALHGFMNLWCEVFGCDEHPGNWQTNAGRVVTVAVALILTEMWRRRQRPRT
jgi:uncharacterized protein